MSASCEDYPVNRLNYAGKGVKRGAQYGVFAGICIPETLHATHSYIAATYGPARRRVGNSQNQLTVQEAQRAAACRLASR